MSNFIIQDIDENYPAIHEDADLLAVYRRLSWTHKWNNTPALAPFASIFYDKAAVTRFNQQ